MNRDEGELDAIRGINHTQRFSSEEKYNRGLYGVAPTNAAGVFCPGTGRWRMNSPMRVARVKGMLVENSVLF